MDISAFLRLFQLRSKQIMWFLGAGASRAAGIKTAGDMIWDFKQRLYRSQRRLPPSLASNLSVSSLASFSRYRNLYLVAFNELTNSSLDESAFTS